MAVGVAATFEAIPSGANRYLAGSLRLHLLSPIPVCMTLPRRPIVLALAALSALIACRPAPSNSPRAGDSLTSLRPRLATGVRLDPAAPMLDVGSFPLAAVAAPDSHHVVLSLNGFREQGIQIVERETGRVVQTLAQPAAFIGVAFSPDGHTLYGSGGNQDVVYRYTWSAKQATLRDSFVLAPKAARADGTRYPAGLAPSRDGRMLYVAENLADSLAVIDVASGSVVQRVATERYPYAVAVSQQGTVYVSAWGGRTVSIFDADPTGRLREGERLPVGRHPSAMLLNRTGTRLFVASGSTDQIVVVDTRRRRVITRLFDPPPAGPDEGVTPNALALASDETRLFVAEADANAVGIFDLTDSTSDVAGAKGKDRLSGRVPTGWYPTALLTAHDSLFVVNGKGRGSFPNPEGPQPLESAARRGVANSQYTYALLSGTIMIAPLAAAHGDALGRLSARVAQANGWTDSTRRKSRRYPPFEHVIYVIKENRSYDQVLGDLREGDGDTSLVFFPRAISPNHHALAERFGLFDRFFVSAEVSADGHNWSTAAYASDYLEKTVQSNYSHRGRSYDYEGTNRGFGITKIPEDDVNAPANGYLWDLADRKGVSFRNYGEFVVANRRDSNDPPAGYRGNKPFLYSHTDPDYPGFELTIRDQHRADVWIEEFQRFGSNGNMPALEIIRLPNDHTSGAMAGRPTPLAAMGDNDLALGRMVEALSHSPYWKNTVMFVLEDDAQNGPDHVDAHRSPLLVISPYGRPGAIHRFANTTDVLRTIEEILGLNSLAQFDYYGRPLREIWAGTPDLRPYTALVPAVSLDAVNPGGTREARESEKLDLRFEDRADERLFNRILWQTLKGRRAPYPGAKRMAPLEVSRGAGFERLP